MCVCMCVCVCVCVCVMMLSFNHQQIIMHDLQSQRTRLTHLFIGLFLSLLLFGYSSEGGRSFSDRGLIDVNTTGEILTPSHMTYQMLRPSHMTYSIHSNNIMRNLLFNRRY